MAINYKTGRLIVDSYLESWDAVNTLWLASIDGVTLRDTMGRKRRFKTKANAERAANRLVTNVTLGK